MRGSAWPSVARLRARWSTRSRSLVGAAAREVAQGAVLERVLDEVLATEVLDHIVDRAEHAGAVHRLADRVLADGIIERAAERFPAGPEFERLVVLTVDSPAMERAIASVFESRLLDQVVAQLLAGPELWRVVDEVARSPAVLDAMAAQRSGFADQVAGEVRDRSRSADDGVTPAAPFAWKRHSGPPSNECCFVRGAIEPNSNRSRCACKP